MMTRTKKAPAMNPELPEPGFFAAGNARRWEYRPDAAMLLDAAAEWRIRHKIKPAAADVYKIHLLLIDVQKDFCFPEGTLYVGGKSGTGAMDDNARLAAFIYRNLARIAEITPTMDTHFPHQIFFPSFWVDEAGRHPSAHTVLTTAKIQTGEVTPNPALAHWLCSGNLPWLQRQVFHYVEQLEQTGKYELYLWPPHCLLGSEGHVLAGAIQEARLFHAYTRGARGEVQIKGGHALTENYSILAPEVRSRHDGKTLAQRNTLFLKTLLEADAIVIAGQAASHCVKSTIEDLLGEIRAQDPALAGRFYILRDCMSSVAIPDNQRPGRFMVDFTPQAEAALQAFAAAGMHLVDTTMPMDTWPGLRQP